MIQRSLANLVLLLSFLSPVASASYFDCSVVYDEFNQLMMAGFLIDPERYVSSIPSAITREEYLAHQKDIFRLRVERANAGIAVFRTNQNIRGKFVYQWQPDPRERLIPLNINEIISFGRVSDGYAPVRATSIYLTPGSAVDLDQALVVELDDETADLVYSFENGVYTIRTVEPAELYFPIESMCHQVQAP